MGFPYNRYSDCLTVMYLHTYKEHTKYVKKLKYMHAFNECIIIVARVACSCVRTSRSIT